MVGQTRLLAKLDCYTLDTLPKTILFFGEQGAGKHTIARYLAAKFNLDLVELTTSVTAEALIDYQSFPIDRFYLIDLNAFVEKYQNQFLKFIEEPPVHGHVILLASSEIGILPTVLNRCAKFHLAQYTIEELRSLNWLTAGMDDLVLTICNTPGRAFNADSENIHKLYNLCIKIVDNLDAASYVNIISIVSKINYKDEYSKFDFDLFFRALEVAAADVFRRTNTQQSYKIYTFTNNFRQNLINKNIAKESFMLNFITRLWEIVH